MEPEQVTTVSVLEPVGWAIEKVKQILFRPFDLGRWFVIGFCAWLACLDQGGGFNFNIGRMKFDRYDASLFDKAKDFVTANLVWIIPTAITVVLLIIAVGIVMIWLSSRGKFMFLHCVAENKAEVKIPWRQFKVQGDSLFVFRIIASLISFGFFVLLSFLLVTFIIVLSRAGLKNAAVSVPVIIGIVLFVPLIIAAAIAMAVFYKFTYDFVVPIMYLRRCTCVQGWREFLAMLSADKGAFTLYILFQIVISIAIGMIVMLLFVLGMCLCCCGFFILCIPYINVVVMLPLVVFKRAYSVCYFRQFGADFDVFTPRGIVVE